MATLISQISSSGGRRRCDARCYNAKHDKCTCICGGLNHGKGLQQAIDNTKEIAEAMLEQANTTVAKEIFEQLQLM